jgi:23S rRNA (cytosine1962-C5)-methyltransferase
MKRVDLTTLFWEDYALLDTGEHRKLERFGQLLLDRPDPQALWPKTNPAHWQEAIAHFAWKESGEKWSKEKNVPESWSMSYKEAQCQLSFGTFKHIGIFPEHRAQWDMVSALAQKKPGMRVLNLFGYTGMASIVAAKAGAVVTHVDASKQTMTTVKENIKLSALPDTSIRTVVEDALKYVKRLSSRAEQFEIILLDPPAFGRGPKGEVWKIEEKLSELLLLIPSILSADAELVMVNGYAAGYSARSFGELLSATLQKKTGTIFYGDVGIKEEQTERILPTGIYASWQK